MNINDTYVFILHHESIIDLCYKILVIQFSSITRCVFCSCNDEPWLQTETCSVVFSIFCECGTVFLPSVVWWGAYV